MQILKRVRQKIESQPLLSGAILAPYYAIRTSPAVVRFLDRESIRLMAAEPPPFNDLERGIAADMERDGIAFTTLDALFPGQNLLHKFQEVVEDSLKEARVGRKKTFLLHLWEDTPALDLGNPFIKVSLDARILALASAYIGRWPKFKFYSLNKTIPLPPGSPALGSQRWHRDPGLHRLFKMFIYVNDVLDLGAGPFIYAKGSHRGGRWSHLFPQELSGRRGCYPPADKVEESIPKADIIPATGRAGSVIFCDTLGIHKGGYSTEKERTMFTALYEAPAAFGKAKFHLPEKQILADAPLSRRARFALS